jgi:hypothetical protein
LKEWVAGNGDCDEGTGLVKVCREEAMVAVSGDNVD